MLAHDLHRETRWPTFVPQARSLGVASMLTMQLHVRGSVLGVLVLHSPAADAFSEQSEQVARLLACHAAVARARTRRLEALDAALASRDVIGRATGMLMQRHTVAGGRAAHLIERRSRATGRPVHDVAHELVLARRPDL